MTQAPGARSNGDAVSGAVRATETLRIFVSSPDDVFQERERLDGVVRALNTQCGDALYIETVRWERAFYTANRTFQAQIPEAADCDIVIGILGHKLGTPPKSDFIPRQPDGEPYPSGTAYELMTALAAADRGGTPEVVIFRKTVSSGYTVLQEAEYLAARRRFQELEDWVERHVKSSHRFSGAEDFERLVRQLLSQRVEARLKTTLRQFQRKTEGSPFRGLQAFGTKDADIYFGRDRKVQRAIQKLQQAAASDNGRPFLLIVGPSGAGKSSLMQAGLAPRLMAPGAVPDIDLWRIAVMKPGGGPTPIAALANALFAGPDGFGTALPELANGPFGTPELLAGALRPTANPAVTAAPVLAALDAAAAALAAKEQIERPLKAQLLVLVDQLEELFAATVPRPEQNDFAATLSALAQSRRVWIVATLRADVYEDLLSPSVPALLALKDRGEQYDLASPGEAEIVEILERSAEAAGVVYGEDPETGERLDERLLRDAQDARNLPLLQMTLAKLFSTRRKRTVVPPGSAAEYELSFEDYRELGGLTSIIETTANDALKKLSMQAPSVRWQEHLPRVLRSLAVPVVAHDKTSGFTSRTLPRDRVAPDTDSRALVNALLDARILVTTKPDPKGPPLLRIAHDKVLSAWSEAINVIVADQRFFRSRDEIEAMRDRWTAAGERRDRLLPAGRPLAEAEEILADYGGELDEETKRYIAASSRREAWRRRLRRAAFAGVAALALLATGLAITASGAATRAQTRLEAARELADKLIVSVSTQLRTTEGMSVTVLNDILESLRGMMEGIAIREAPPQSPPQVAMERLSTLALRLLGADAGDAATQLQRSQAAMEFEFARTFHETRTRGRARGPAEASLAQRRLLRQVAPGPHADWDLANSLEQMSDIERSDGAIVKARAYAEEALTLLRSLAVSPNPAADHVVGLSRILTRLGDLARSAPADREAARRFYDEALVVTRELRARDRIHLGAIGELSWALRKSGELHMDLRDFAQASQAFEQAVCIRRYLLDRDVGNIGLRRDLGFFVTLLGRALFAAGDFGRAEAAHMEALSARRRVQQSDSRSTQSDAQFGGSLFEIAQVHARAEEYPLALAFAEHAAEWAARSRSQPLQTDAVALRDDALSRLGPASTLPVDDARRRGWAEGIALSRLQQFETAPAGQRSDNSSCTTLDLPAIVPAR